MLRTLGYHCSGLCLGWQGGGALSPILLKAYSAPRTRRMALGPIKTVSHEHQVNSGICIIFCILPEVELGSRGLPGKYIYPQSHLRGSCLVFETESLTGQELADLSKLTGQ